MSSVFSKSCITLDSVLIAVQSGPGSAGARAEIRSTWGRLCHRASWCRLIFSLGSAGSLEVQADVEEEAREFGDLLQDRFVDTYNNLTIKTLHILRYFLFEETGCQYLMKTDDDSYVGVSMQQTTSNAA